MLQGVLGEDHTTVLTAFPVTHWASRATRWNNREAPLNLVLELFPVWNQAWIGTSFYINSFIYLLIEWGCQIYPAVLQALLWVVNDARPRCRVSLVILSQQCCPSCLELSDHKDTVIWHYNQLCSPFMRNRLRPQSLHCGEWEDFLSSLKAYLMATNTTCVFLSLSNSASALFGISGIFRSPLAYSLKLQ